MCLFGQLLSALVAAYHRLLNYLLKPRQYVTLCDLLQQISSTSKRQKEEQFQLAKLCDSQYKLTLLLGRRAGTLLADIEFSTVYKTEQLRAKPLLQHLRHISTLVVALDGLKATTVGQLSRLLQAWSHQITELELHIKVGTSRPDRATSRYILQFIAHTSAMDKLEYLVVIVTGHIFPDSSPHPVLQLPILSRLLMLYFKSYDSPAILTDSLLNYATDNWTLEQIHLRNTFYEDNEVQMYLELPSELAAKFAYLDFDLASISPTLLEPFLQHFNSLHSLCVHLDETSIDRLAMLPDLAHLRLCLHTPIEQEPASNSSPPARQLSVASLSLAFDLPDPHRFDLFSLLSHFSCPTIGRVHLVSFQCVRCGYSQPSNKSRRCALKLLDPLEKVNRPLYDTANVD